MPLSFTTTMPITVGAGSNGLAATARAFSSFGPRWPENLDKARTGLWLRSPYLGRVLWALQPVRDAAAVPTIGVDESLRLFYNPGYIDARSHEELVALLYHECRHWMGAHLERFRPLEAEADFDQETALVAADLAINPAIRDAGFTLPPGGVYPDLFGLAEGQTLEAYYRALRPNVDPQARQDGQQDQAGQGAPTSGSSGSGSGSGSGQGKPKRGKGGAGSKSGAGTQQAGGDAPQGCASLSVVSETDRAAGDAREAAARAQGATRLPKALLDGLADATARDVRAAPTRGIGSAPGDVRRWAEAYTQAAYDWRRELAGLLGEIASSSVGTFDQSYRRPSRRQAALPGVLLPGTVAAHPRGAIVLDVSGSMGSGRGSLIEAAIPQVKAVAAAAGCEIELLAYDTVVQSRTRVSQGTSRFNVSGGGGTSMDGGILAALAGDAAGRKPAFVVVLTDGQTRWRLDRSRVGSCRLIVGVLASDFRTAEEYRKQVPAWMRSLNLADPTTGGGY